MVRGNKKAEAGCPASASLGDMFFAARKTVIA
jgi:hypothetical protein